jgi:hypothetical protein
MDEVAEFFGGEIEEPGGGISIQLSLDFLARIV